MKLERITADAVRHVTALYGYSGVGKTTLSATAPKPLFLDSNAGTMSVADRVPAGRRVTIHSMDDLEEAYERLKPGGKWAKKFKGGTVIFDHWDDIQAIVIEQLGEKAALRDDRRDVDELQMKEWGTMGNRLRRYLRKFKRLPYNIILICGEKEDRDTGRMKPSLLGALGSQLPYFVDHTMYLRVGKKGQRFVHLDSTDEFYAKTRARWLKERKLRFREDDTTFLTDLFERIAAGPKSTNRGEED